MNFDSSIFVAIRALAFLLVVFLALASAVKAQVENGFEFAHPGLLHDQRQLIVFKAAITSLNSDEAFRSGYDALRRDFRASYRYVPHPAAIVIVAPGSMPASEKSFKDDAIAAYLNALQWVATDDTRHRDKTFEILDGWAAAFQDIVAVYETPVSASLERTRALESAWVLPIWVNAAEIMRHFDDGSAEWGAESVVAFSQFIERLYAQQRSIDGNPSNRGVSAALSMLTAGVFLDDRARYQEGLQRLRRLLPVVIKPDGEIRELRSRDCHHPQYSLTGFIQAAEIAGNQNDETLWKESGDQGSPYLARALEYIAVALVDGSEARDCRGKRLLPGYAIFAVIQAGEIGVQIPRFSALVLQRGPDSASYQFIGWAAAVRPFQTVLR